MAHDRPSYMFEQQYPSVARQGTIWPHYGTYRSFAHARAKAARLDRPCRITLYRIVWRSVPIR